MDGELSSIEKNDYVAAWLYVAQKRIDFGLYAPIMQSGCINTPI